VIPAIGQLTVNAALDLFRSWQTQLDSIASKISQTNGHLIAADQAAERIADPTARSAAKARIRDLVSRQATLVARWRAIGGNAMKFRDGLRAFMQSIGLQTAGLGAIQFLPAALLVLAGVIVTALVTLGPPAQAFLIQAQSEHRRIELAAEHPEQAAALLRQERSPGFDPLGLKSLGDAVVPLLGIAAAVFLLPQLLKTRRA